MTSDYSHISIDFFAHLDSFLEPDSGLAALDKTERYEIYESCLGKLLCQLYFDQDAGTDSDMVFSQAAESGRFCMIFPEGFDPGSIAMAPVLDPKQRVLRPLALIAPGASRDLYLGLYINEDFEKLSEKDQHRFVLRIINAPDSFKPSETGCKLISSPRFLIDSHKFEALVRKADALKASPELKELSQLFSHYNNSITFDRYSLHKEYESLELARVKAAFFANGISYSDARRADDHYSHLVDQSEKWFVLFKLRENSLLKVTDNRDILFTIRYDDFQNGDFEKGRVVLS